jgi:hypothetical protein
MPDVTATVNVPDSKVRLLTEAYETYKTQHGLDSSFTSQMFFDELFQATLTGQWRMADVDEITEFAQQYEAADDATRAEVDLVFNPTP